MSEHEPIARKTRKVSRGRVKHSLYAKAREWQLSPKAIQTFSLYYRGSLAPMPKGLKADSSAPSAYHILYCRPRAKKRRSTAADDMGIAHVTALVGQEVNSELTSFSRIQSR